MIAQVVTPPRSAVAEALWQTLGVENSLRIGDIKVRMRMSWKEVRPAMAELRKRNELHSYVHRSRTYYRKELAAG